MDQIMDIQTMLNKYKWFCCECASFIKQRDVCGREYVRHEYGGKCAYNASDVREAEKQKAKGVK